MKLLLQLLFSFALLLSTVTTGFSQAVKTEEDDREPSRIGYGVNIGNIRFGNRTFEFGLAPNIAYRVSESFAVGFMVKVDYFYEKFAPEAKFSAFDFGPTVFARMKPLWSWDNATPFLKGLFLQAEYERGFLSRPSIVNGSLVVNDGKVVKDKKQENFVYVGIGATTGYPFSTFVSLHYNLLDHTFSSRLPFAYRIGFTYNY